MKLLNFAFVKSSFKSLPISNMEFDTQSIWYIVYAITFLAAAIIIYFLYLEIVDLKKKVNAQANAGIRAQAVDAEAFENSEEAPELGSFEFEQENGVPDGHFMSIPRNVMGVHQHNIVVDQNGNHFMVDAAGNAHAIPSGIPGGIPVHPQIVQMHVQVPMEQSVEQNETSQIEEIQDIEGEQVVEEVENIVEEESASLIAFTSGESSTVAQPTDTETEEIPEEIEIVVHPQTPSKSPSPTASVSYVEKCKKILTVGKNKGNECGKIAVERGLCRNHAAFAT